MYHPLRIGQYLARLKARFHMGQGGGCGARAAQMLAACARMRGGALSNEALRALRIDELRVKRDTLSRDMLLKVWF